MTRARRRAPAALAWRAAAAALLALGCSGDRADRANPAGGDAASEPAREFRTGDIVVSGAVIPAPPPMSPAGAYFTVRNAGARPDTLLRIAVAGDSAHAELHEEMAHGETMVMHPVPRMEIPAGGTVHLVPGGLHVMLTGLGAPPAAGDSLAFTLTFQRAGELPVMARVIPYTDLQRATDTTGGG